MASRDKEQKIEARLPRGFADRGAVDIRAAAAMIEAIGAVFERYGFEAVETPFVEYTEALGKFLPDQDRPNEGVFSFQDDDGQWLSLRYDLTAPLARYVAQNFEALPKPYRSWRAGWVFRNEKPGPGRFRQFLQCDADIVGAAGPAADAEIAMMMADTLEALGIPRGDYVIKVHSRKVLDALMASIGLAGDEHAGRRLKVLRAVDKLDRLGEEGVRLLLGAGRKDESGDFTPGAGLGAEQIAELLQVIVRHQGSGIRVADYQGPDVADEDVSGGIVYSNREVLSRWDDRIADAGGSSHAADDLWRVAAHQAVDELRQMADLIAGAGYGTRRIRIDPSVVRGLEYYTGAVFEAELTFAVPNERGEPVVFGSVAGGGRYDGLVGRFRDEVPATGFSIGVSRLAAALKAKGRLGGAAAPGPVVVTVMDRDRLADYQRMTAELRAAGIRAELYLGAAGMKAQLKYADRRGAPCVVIQGTSERDAGLVQIKDLAAGKAQSAAVADHAAWRQERPGQFEVARDTLVTEIAALLGRQAGG